MSNIIYSGHVVVLQGDKLLLVKHEEKASHLTGVYGIPGGRPDKGESILDAAARELEEESGIKANKKDLHEFSNNKYTADIKRKEGLRRMTMTVYVCVNFSGDLKSSPESSPEWVKMSGLDNYNLLPNVKKAAEAGLEYLKNEKAKS
jgi:8-oxo-dGTP diphosphatase